MPQDFHQLDVRLPTSPDFEHIFAARAFEPFADKVHVDHRITSVKRRHGRFLIADAKGRSYEADRVVFACDATSVLNALESPSWLQRLLFSNAQFLLLLERKLFWLINR